MESEWAALRPQLEQFGRTAIEVLMEDGALAPGSVEIHTEESGGVSFLISYDREAGSRLRIRSAMMKTLSRGHREYVSVLDEHGTKLGDKVLDAVSDELEVDLSSATQAPTVLQFVALGVEHILTGYDHLVFLFGLLLAGAGFKDIAKIISSFTAAHSITLALSALDLVRVPSAVVEPLIAVSIVYVGIENVLRRGLKWRWLLTFGFGLFHGFGFASALRELGIGSGPAAALPLISFNVGVEAGQLVVAAVVLPLIWQLRRRPIFVTRLSPACSILVSIAGSIWLIERVLGE
jgi:hydrogenase/urease accessory protein HupE